jgi:hypothetical protein
MLENIIIIGIAVLLLAPSIILLVSAWSRKRGRFFPQLRQHFKAQVASRRIWVPLMCAAALLLLPFSLVAHDPPIVIAVWCIASGTIMRWLTPPSIMLLGVSGSKCNEIIGSLTRALFPAKLFHLLRDNYTKPGRGWDVKLETMITTSRTSGDVRWEEVVSIYLRMCEGVLVDLRNHSGNLHVELSMITSMADRKKVLYLIDEETNHEAFLRENADLTQLCVTLELAIVRLRQACRMPGTKRMDSSINRAPNSIEASSEIAGVRGGYSPSDLWSKVGKKICSRFLVFRTPFTWSKAMKDFKEEFDYIERTRGSILDETMERASDFLARLACALRYHRRLSEQDATRLVHAFDGNGDFEPIHNSLSAAVLLKGCLEIGRLRPAPRRGLLGMTVMHDLRTVDELLSFPIEQPLPYRAEFDSMKLSIEEHAAFLRKARTTPDYHLAVARAAADFEYRSAVSAVARHFPILSDAVEVLQKRAPLSKDERLFLERYPEMCKLIA